jgi:phosphohistidine phosphatase
MLLYIVRHAWAAEFGDPSWPDDELRPLTSEGCERFARMAKTLVGRGVAPQRIATSPLVRCRQTADILAEQVAGKPQIVPRTELAPGSDLDGLLEWTRTEAGRCEQVAWVGHAPDVGLFVAELCGVARGQIRFAKGAVAAIEFDGPPATARGELRWLVTAKILGC